MLYVQLYIGSTIPRIPHKTSSHEYYSVGMNRKIGHVHSAIITSIIHMHIDYTIAQVYASDYQIPYYHPTPNIHPPIDAYLGLIGAPFYPRTHTQGI